MSTLSQILETLNECVNINTDAFTVFEHGSEKVCFISDLLNLSKSKKPILMQLPSTPEDLECANVTEEMLESEQDIYPKVSPLIGLDKLTYTVKGYLAVKSIVEYENFILLSYLKDSNLTSEELEALSLCSQNLNRALNIKSIRKEFKQKIAHKKEISVDEVKGKHLRKYLLKLSEKVLVSDVLNGQVTSSVISTRNIIPLYYTNEYIELLFVDDTNKKNVFCLTQFDQ